MESGKRLSGLAIGLGVGAATAAGAGVGVMLDNVFSKKHYDLDDDDEDIEDVEETIDDNTQEEPKENTNLDDDNYPREHHHHHHHHHHHDREQGDGMIDEPADDPGFMPGEGEMAPLGWYAEVDEDGNDVYFFLIGDEESGGAMYALAESQPGSGIYDTVIDMTTEPYSVEHIDNFYTREELENTIPNPYTADAGMDDEPLGPDIPAEGEDIDDDDDGDIIDDDMIDDDEGDIIDDDLIGEDDILDEDEVLLDDDEVVLGEDDVILDDDEVVIDEDDVILDDDNVAIGDEGTDSGDYDTPPELDETYAEEDLYPEDQLPDEPIDDSMMV